MPHTCKGERKYRGNGIDYTLKTLNLNGILYGCRSFFLHFDYKAREDFDRAQSRSLPPRTWQLGNQRNNESMIFCPFLFSRNTTRRFASSNAIQKREKIPSRPRTRGTAAHSTKIAGTFSKIPLNCIRTIWVYPKSGSPEMPRTKIFFPE